MTITVAITGASGAIYALHLLYALHKEPRVDKIYVVITHSGKEVWKHELPTTEIGEIGGLSPKIEILDNNSFFAPIASGSNASDAMVIIPASMGTVGRIANGVSSTLLERAADVQLKEQLPLIIVARETPLSLIHLRNLTSLSEAGAMILPASPSFYSAPSSIEELIGTVIERILSKIGLQNQKTYCWNKK